MKPVVLSLCLILLFMAGIVSGSLDDCPTCVYAYDSNGNLIADSNPYAGCPACVFAYDSNGNLLPNADTGCSSCVVSSGTTNTLGTCTSCSFVSSVSRSEIVYRFPDGTPVPDDYLCPVHGLYCPDDPRPLELRPGYVAPIPTIRPTPAPRILPDTSAEFISLFKRPSSLPRSERLSVVLDQSIERPRKNFSL